MSLLRDDSLTHLAFSLHANKGIYALLLGSGVSRAASIPTGWEITLDLIRRVAAAKGVSEQPDWAEWYRAETGQEPEYSSLVADVASSQEERRSLLDRYIEADESDRFEGKKAPTAAHRAIAKLVRMGYFKVVITTNFDRLLENALRDEGVEPTVVSSVDALAGAEPLIHCRCFIFKVHGDYKDTRILNTDDELKAYPHEYSQLLGRIFDEYGLVICGWSGDWDPALRGALVSSPSRRYSTYWATRGELGNSASELASQKRARLVPIASADEFFSTLLKRIEAIEYSQQSDPKSVELLVANAKRHIGKRDSRVELADCFEHEANALVGNFVGPDFSPQGQWTPEEFSRRVAVCESCSEALAKMAGVMGRWGDGSELSLVLDVIRTLHKEGAGAGNGQVSFINLRSYPAVLVFTAYGLGLTKARRWTSLHDLLFAKIPAGRNEPKRLVSTLFLTAWSGGEAQTWQALEGMARRKTPLSDHLLAVMQEWKSSFIGTDPDFELLFERFEFLAGLAYLEENDEASLEASATDANRSVLAWMPYGRAIWRDEGRALLGELKEPSCLLALAEAGFGQGSSRFIELFAMNFQRFVERVRWS